MSDFSSGAQLLDLCQKENLPISQVMLARELAEGKTNQEEISSALDQKLTIMRQSAQVPLTQPQTSMGGLVGGEAQALIQSKALCGATLHRALAYSLGVLEVNASMGLIVAAPTAGASGVLPGVLFSLEESHQLSHKQLQAGLMNAAAVGYLFMRNASVSGAEAGCQAEVGVASAMAASAMVEMLGGSPAQCLRAATFAVSNLLGLVCDPIAGLVESPCQTRNAIGVSNAFTSAQLAWSGIVPVVPFDEIVMVMYQVGTSLPASLRETALGGTAAAPTACAFACKGKS